jgi:ethanolamine transporter EutH
MTDGLSPGTLVTVVFGCIAAVLLVLGRKKTVANKFAYGLAAIAAICIACAGLVTTLMSLAVAQRALVSH